MEPEPLLTPNPDRFTLFPIVHSDLYRLYKNLVSVRWITEEVDMSRDRADFEALGPNEQHFIKCILGFFAGADGIVCENLCANFCDEVQAPEAKAFYCEQMANEVCHSETYSLLIDTYFTTRAQKDDVWNAIRTMPFVEKKAAWALKWIPRDAPFAKRLLAFAIVEGVFFSGAFCAIYWFKDRNLLKGLTVANEFISRDEGLHTNFAVALYNKLEHRLSRKEVHQLFREAVAIEKEFILEALPCSLIGMNAGLMSTYIEFVADHLLVQLNYPKLFSVQNPFAFMERISLESKGNFFETKISNYALANCGGKEEDRVFRIDCEF